MLGKHVLVRTYSAGVHVGVLQQHNGREVILTTSRRIWSWKGAFTLSEIAMKGLDSKHSRMSMKVPEILLTEAIEIIPTTEAARNSFEKCHE